MVPEIERLLYDIIAILGLLCGAGGIWYMVLRMMGGGPGGPPSPPVIRAFKPSEANREDREGRADDLADEIARSGPHESPGGFNDEGPEDTDVDAWVESK